MPDPATVEPTTRRAVAKFVVIAAGNALITALTAWLVGTLHTPTVKVVIVSPPQVVAEGVGEGAFGGFAEALVSP